MQNNKPNYYNDLDKVHLKIWSLLDLGLKNRDAPFHIPVFICGNENSFDGRIVVLRGINDKEKKLWFHSDIRSNKIKILKKNPNATLLFYDKGEKIQLRISGKASINYKNERTKISWQKTTHMSRQCYLGEKAPGVIFCVVEIFINSIEWLYLAAKGHRRAYFSFKNNSLEKKWLIP